MVIFSRINFPDPFASLIADFQECEQDDCVFQLVSPLVPSFDPSFFSSAVDNFYNGGSSLNGQLFDVLSNLPCTESTQTTVHHPLSMLQGFDSELPVVCGGYEIDLEIPCIRILLLVISAKTL